MGFQPYIFSKEAALNAFFNVISTLKNVGGPYYSAWRAACGPRAVGCPGLPYTLSTLVPPSDISPPNIVDLSAPLILKGRCQSPILGNIYVDVSPLYQETFMSMLVPLPTLVLSTLVPPPIYLLFKSILLSKVNVCSLRSLHQRECYLVILYQYQSA